MKAPSPIILRPSLRPSRSLIAATLVFALAGAATPGLAQTENISTPSLSAPKPTLTSRLRREAFSDIVFQPKPREEIPPIFLHDPAPPSDDPDRVSLEPMIVTDRPLPRGLHEKILATQRADEAGKPKFGTGILYRKDFKRVRLEVGTILFIPVAVGISW